MTNEDVTIRVPSEFNEMLIREKQSKGLTKIKLIAGLTSLYECFQNRVDFNKTFDTMLEVKLLATFREEAVKMGAKPELRKKFDDVIDDYKKLLKEYRGEKV